MSKRIKTITAGRLVSAVCYTVAGPRDGEQERSCKREMSSAGQDSVNLRRSWQKLEMTLAANFGGHDSTWSIHTTPPTSPFTGTRP